MSKIRLHGSSSGYTDIAPVAASGNNTITLPNDGTIISHDSAGAIGVTSVRATNAHFSGTTRVTTGITTTSHVTGDLKFNSGYGSAATAYGIRSWMQYRGDTNAIIGSANVSTVTDNDTGDFTMNFTTAMPDTNYGVLGTTGYNDTSLNIGLTASGTHAAFTTSAMRFTVNVNYNSSLSDERYISVAIVR